jgi:hypothetical protein
MVEVRFIDTYSKNDVNDFVDLPFKLYKDCPFWVPPFKADVRMMLNRDKHPFYERSEADFILATKNGETVGRMAIMEHKPFNHYHNCSVASFTLFDCVEDKEVFDAMWNAADEWARKRGLDAYIGPKGLCSFDGYGILTDGFDQRQMMTMSRYNYPYYPKFFEESGFETYVDFLSCYLHKDNFQLTDKVRRVAERVKEKGKLRVLEFSSKGDLFKWVPKIGELYNNTFIHNWEYYPLSDGEVSFLLSSLKPVLDHRLIKLILHEDDIVGFCLAFKDLSAALQRQKGRLTPWGLADILLEGNRTNWVDVNGIGVLPEFYGSGGNALMYYELERSIKQFNFEHLEMSQVANSAVQMRKDLKNLGGKEYKNHRVYKRTL